MHDILILYRAGPVSEIIASMKLAVVGVASSSVSTVARFCFVVLSSSEASKDTDSF